MLSSVKPNPQTSLQDATISPPHPLAASKLSKPLLPSFGAMGPPLKVEIETWLLKGYSANLGMVCVLWFLGGVWDCFTRYLVSFGCFLLLFGGMFCFCSLVSRKGMFFLCGITLLPLRESCKGFHAGEVLEGQTQATRLLVLLRAIFFALKNISLVFFFEFFRLKGATPEACCGVN